MLINQSINPSPIRPCPSIIRCLCHSQTDAVATPLIGLMLSDCVSASAVHDGPAKSLIRIAADTVADASEPVVVALQGSVLWDGAVCLADFLTQPPQVILSHHTGFARRRVRGRSWQWKDKTVVSKTTDNRVCPK